MAGSIIRFALTESIRYWADCTIGLNSPPRKCMGRSLIRGDWHVDGQFLVEALFELDFNGVPERRPTISFGLLLELGEKRRIFLGFEREFYLDAKT